MRNAKTQVRRKSLHRSKNCQRAKRFAQMRAAKERKRMERVARDEPLPDLPHVPQPKGKPSGFLITIKCLDDGERVKLRTLRDPWGGLTVSPTMVGRKVAAVIAHYTPSQ